MSEGTVEGRGLTLAQRRKLGITLGNCIRVARQLKRQGELSEDSDVAAGQIAIALAGDNPAAWGDPGVDWDAILAFIEKLIPLIMKIIALFGGI